MEDDFDDYDYYSLASFEFQIEKKKNGEWLNYQLMYRKLY